MHEFVFPTSLQRDIGATVIYGHVRLFVCVTVQKTLLKLSSCMNQDCQTSSLHISQHSLQPSTGWPVLPKTFITYIPKMMSPSSNKVLTYLPADQVLLHKTQSPWPFFLKINTSCFQPPPYIFHYALFRTFQTSLVHSCYHNSHTKPGHCHILFEKLAPSHVFAKL